MALGIDDPEAWLDRIDQRTFDVWRAYYQIEPFGNEWAQTASVLSMASVTQSLMAATAGTKMEALPPIEFMPGDSLGWVKRKRKDKGIKNGALQQQYIMAAFGFRA